MRYTASVAFILALSGCHSSELPPLVAVDGAYTITVGPITLDPGQEITYCIHRRLIAAGPVQIKKIENDIQPGGHHLALYTAAEGQEETPAIKCNSFLDVAGGGIPLFGTDSPHDSLTMPEGVAYTVPENTVVTGEAHFINATHNTVTSSGTIKIYTYDPSEPVNAQASIFFYGDTDIVLPPGEHVTVGPAFHPVPAGKKIFATTSHTHHLGTYTHMSLSTGKQDEGMLLYENVSWDEHTVKLYDPPLSVATGQGLRFYCEYMNTTDHTVNFGTSALDEMCFVFAFYYPSDGLYFWQCGKDPNEGPC